MKFRPAVAVIERIEKWMNRADSNRKNGSMPVRFYFRILVVILLVEILNELVIPQILESMGLWSDDWLHHLLKSLIILVLTIPLLYFWVLRQSMQIQDANKRALKSENRFRSLYEYTPNGIYSVDVNGEFTRANQSLAKLIGRSQEELRTLPWTELVVAGDIEKVKSYFTRCVQKRFHVTYSLSLRHESGQVVDVMVTHVPMLVEERIEGVHAIVQDITLFKQSEEMMRRTENLKSAGQLAAGIAHELRNSMTAVKGFLQLLRAEVYGRDEYFRIIQDELKHMNSILNEFLSLAKPKTRHLQKKNLDALVRETVDLMRTQAILNNVDIEVDLQANQVLIQCDETQMKEVLVNVLKNSIEALPLGGVIHVGTSTTDRQVRLVIHDTGEGIPEEILSRLGEPFFTTKDKGTGLGLSICRKIIEEHAGQFEMSSQSGEGTTVEIVLPVVIEDKVLESLPSHNH